MFVVVYIFVCLDVFCFLLVFVIFVLIICNCVYALCVCVCVCVCMYVCVTANPTNPQSSVCSTHMLKITEVRMYHEQPCIPTTKLRSSTEW